MDHADRVELFRSYLLHGSSFPNQEQERRADGCGLAVGSDECGVSVAAAFCRVVAVRRGCAATGGASGGRGADRGRYGLSEDGPALGRCGAAVLQAIRQKWLFNFYFFASGMMKNIKNYKNMKQEPNGGVKSNGCYVVTN
jgi:hypothetical protein